MSACTSLRSGGRSNPLLWCRRIACLTLPVGLSFSVARPLAGVQTRSAAYQVVTVRDGATLAGRVTFSGEVPKPSRLLITRDIEVCGAAYRERNHIVVGEGGGLRDVVVFIEGIDAGKAWRTTPEPYALDQEDCYFDPVVQVIQWGAELNIINSDPVLHNIHSYELIGSARRTLFNFGQPPDKDVITRAIRPRRSRRIRVECDAHDFMLAWLVVVENPYAVVADAHGRFTMEDIPPGRYTVKAWHPHLGMREQEITVSAQGAAEIAFRFSGN